VRVSFHTSGRWKNFRTPHFNPLTLFKGRGEQCPSDIGFGFPGLDFGISIFEFQLFASPRAAAYKTIVSPRAGPTLTMDNFAPVNSEMYLTYFLAAEGSCENFRVE
jgi:hypothetical protein